MPRSVLTARRLLYLIARALKAGARGSDILNEHIIGIVSRQRKDGYFARRQRIRNRR